MTDSAITGAAQTFVETLAGFISDALGRTTGTTWKHAPQTGQKPPSEQMASFAVKLATEKESAAVILVARKEAARLVQCLLGGGDAGSVAELSEDDSAVLAGVIEEAVNSSLHSFGINLSAEAKLDADQTMDSDRELTGLSFTDENATAVLFVVVSARLCDIVERSQATGASKVTAPQSVPPTPCDGSLDLVLDVELNVVLRFGKRQLSLKELSELSSGSIVELDQEVQEPVELLLNDRVIATGEVVIVDGNYGLRVTEVKAAVQEA